MPGSLSITAPAGIELRHDGIIVRQTHCGAGIQAEAQKGECGRDVRMREGRGYGPVVQEPGAMSRAAIPALCRSAARPAGGACRASTPAAKDGTIRHVMSGLNPQGVRVTSFKVPEGAEKRHDYLWRVHRAVPGIGQDRHFQPLALRGCAGGARARPGAEVGLVEALRADQRFRAHADRQRRRASSSFCFTSARRSRRSVFASGWRTRARTGNSRLADLKERSTGTTTSRPTTIAAQVQHGYAPWYVIPANQKWFRNLAVSQVIVDALEKMKLKFPKPVADLSNIKID